MYGAEGLPLICDQLWFSSTIRKTVRMPAWGEAAGEVTGEEPAATGADEETCGGELAARAGAEVAARGSPAVAATGNGEGAVGAPPQAASSSARISRLSIVLL